MRALPAIWEPLVVRRVVDPEFEVAAARVPCVLACVTASLEARAPVLGARRLVLRREAIPVTSDPTSKEKTL